MSSTNKIDYSSRINKSIERKLIAEGVQRLIQKNNYQYKYIGFGSVWFVDFSLFHKLLHINEMVSIEHDQVVYERALHNKPYYCIDVKLGDSTEKLAEILLETQTPSLIWLDYDAKIFSCASYLKDVEMIVSNCKSGTVLLVTMNVVNDKPRELKKQNNPDWIEKTKDLLKSTFGEINLEGIEAKQLTDQERFISLSTTLFGATVQNAVYNAGNKKTHHKIFDFIYKDGAPMITQGFLLLDTDKGNELESVKEFSSEYFLNQTPFKIQAPILTTREKYAIDKSLPAINPQEFVAEKGIFEYKNDKYINSNDLIGFPVSVESFKSYARLYKYYPTYSEIVSV